MDAKEYLNVAICGEQLSVSYAMLSRKFGISPEAARQLLTDFVASNADTHVTYVLRGVKKHGVSTIELVNGDDVASKRDEYDGSVSQLIYSVSAASTTSAMLYNMAVESTQMGPQKFAIVSELASGVDTTVKKKPVVDTPAPVVRSASSSFSTVPAKKPAAKQKPKLDFFGGKKKTDKKEVKEEPKDVKEEKNEVKNEKNEVKKEDIKKPAMSGILASVKEGHKKEPKPEPPKPKTKKQLEAEEAEKQRKKELEEALFADDDEDIEFDSPKKQTVKEELKRDLEKAEQETKQEEEEMAGGEVDVVTEDVEMGDVVEGVNDVGEQEDVEMEDVEVSMPTAPRRGKKKVVKKVEELDEDGYVTYKKVETWESCDEEEDESGMKEKEVKKEVKKEEKKESPEPTKGKKKKKGQASLMSFFKK